jgi:hypothetical protein
MPPFLEAARDPSLIPGVYNTCDQWCMYCPATARCLAYRCGPELRAGGDVYRTLADRLYAGIVFLKQLCESQGQPTAEIDALLSDDPRRHASLVIVNDRLERMGRHYFNATSAYLQSRSDFPFEMRHRDSGPTPFEVFAWYHALVPTKIYRAIVSAREAGRRNTSRQEDALASAKVALIGIDRSLDALATMSTTDHDRRLEEFRAQLRRLRHEVEARFPAARGRVRVGLDT